jgi:hypothetical protein
MPPSRNRLARTYKPVAELDPSPDSFPYTSNSLVSSVQRGPYIQGLLAKEQNFSADLASRCPVFEINCDGYGAWHDLEGQKAISEYLFNVSVRNTAYCVVFCLLTKVDGASFKHQVSLSNRNNLELLKQFNVSPQFVSKLLGEPDHWAPGYYELYGQEPRLQQLQFFCQHPRWYIHEQETAVSVHMSYDFAQRRTMYIVSCAESSIAGIKKRLCDDFCNQQVMFAEKPLIARHVPDPFMLHSLINHESLEDGKPLFTKLRHRLYDVLDEVDDYAAQKREHRKRRVLEEATIGLHDISQDIDSTIAALDMSQALTDRLLEAQASYSKLLDNSTSKPSLQTRDAITYLSHSTASQRRWLLSYKSRKDIAMNLVFNLVTQQDAASAQATALSAQADASSMKAIAALTMLFLPATFVVTLFGMGALLHATWQSYLAITLPLTAVVMVMWRVWMRWVPRPGEPRESISRTKGLGSLPSTCLSPFRSLFTRRGYQSDYDVEESANRLSEMQMQPVVSRP